MLIYSNMEDNKSIVDIINEQWKDNSKQNGLLGNIPNGRYFRFYGNRSYTII